MIRVTTQHWLEAEELAQKATFGSNDRSRLVKGLLAERVVIEYLQNLDDAAVTWLSQVNYRPLSPRELARVVAVPRSKRKHAGDLVWRGLEIDVKLVSRTSAWLPIKAGAQHLHHLFAEWVREGEALRVAGVLFAHRPETFDPPAPLVHPVTGYRFMRKLPSGAARPVNGWWVHRRNLAPAATLLELSS